MPRTSMTVGIDALAIKETASMNGPGMLTDNNCKLTPENAPGITGILITRRNEAFHDAPSLPPNEAKNKPNVFIKNDWKTIIITA